MCQMEFITVSVSYYLNGQMKSTSDDYKLKKMMVMQLLQQIKRNCSSKSYSKPDVSIGGICRICSGSKELGTSDTGQV